MKQSSLSEEECALSADARWTLVQRILNSAGFVRSTRLSDLLTYVARKALTGKLDEITEQQIGVNVFGRPADYSPAEDNIVRSHARLVRQRLESFYAESTLSILLTIPKGGYVPVFTPRQEPSANFVESDTEPAEVIEAAQTADVVNSQMATLLFTKPRIMALPVLIA
jgi:hypothetical protein